MAILKGLWQFLVGVGICAAGLIILYFDLTTRSSTVADTGSYFFELGIGLALGGGIWAVIVVRQMLGLEKPAQPSEKAPPT
jgi:hypothetical protein